MAFLKVGKVAARTFPSVERAFARLNNYIRVSRGGQQLLKPADRIIIRTIFPEAYDSPMGTYIYNKKTNRLIPTGTKDYLAHSYYVHASINGKIHDIRMIIPANKDKSVNTHLFERMKKVLSELPADSLKTVDRIVLNPQQVPFIAGSAGIRGGLHQITLYPIRYKSSSLSRFTKTMEHELGHTVAHARYGSSTPDRDYIDAITRDNHRVSRYGETNYDEDFAEAMRVYIETDGGIKDPELLRRYANRFRILDEITELDTNTRTQILEDFRIRMARQRIFWTTTAAGGLATLTVGDQTAVFAEQDLLNQVNE